MTQPDLPIPELWQIGTVLASVIAAIITARIEFRKHYTKTIWDKKCNAYSEIFNALHDLRIYFDENQKHEENYEKIPKDREEELRKKFEESWNNFRRKIDSEKWIISYRACTRLKKLEDDLEFAEYGVPVFDLREWASSTEKAMIDLIRISRVDLGLEARFGWNWFLYKIRLATKWKLWPFAKRKGRG